MLGVMENPRSLCARLLLLSPTEQADALRAVESLPPAEAAECALSLLEQMVEAHGTTVGLGCLEILGRRGSAEHLPRLRAVCGHLPAIVAIRDWRQEAGFTVAVLEARARGACACTAVRVAGDRPVTDDFEVLSDVPGDWTAELVVRCRACGVKANVTREDGYHYPLFRWH